MTRNYVIVVGAAVSISLFDHAILSYCLDVDVDVDVDVDLEVITLNQRGLLTRY